MDEARPTLQREGGKRFVKSILIPWKSRTAPPVEEARRLGRRALEEASRLARLSAPTEFPRDAERAPLPFEDERAPGRLWHWSTTNTRGLVAAAVAPAPIGIDAEWLDRFVASAAPWTGRIYIGSEDSVGASPGSGAVFPVARHGGPGRAGDGEEVGGLAGLRLYQQRVALQGAKSIVEGICGGASEEDGA